MRWPRWYAVRRMRHWHDEVKAHRSRFNHTLRCDLCSVADHRESERLLTLAMAKAETWRKRTYR